MVLSSTFSSSQKAFLRHTISSYISNIQHPIFSPPYHMRLFLWAPIIGYKLIFQALQYINGILSFWVKEQPQWIMYLGQVQFGTELFLTKRGGEFPATEIQICSSWLASNFIMFIYIPLLHFSYLSCVPRSAFFWIQPCLCKQTHVGSGSETCWSAVKWSCLCTQD